MPYCAVPKCESSSRKLKQYKVLVGENKITFHQFPLGTGKEELLKKWLKKISRNEFVPTAHSKVCSLHFRPDDFQQERSGTNPRRKRSLVDKRPKKKILNSDAVPSVFEGYPSYLTGRATKSPAKKRKTARRTTAGARRKLLEKREEETLEAETSMFLESEMFTDLKGLEDKLRSGGLSVTGFDGIRRKDALLLCFIELIELTDSRLRT